VRTHSGLRRLLVAGVTLIAAAAIAAGPVAAASGSAAVTAGSGGAHKVQIDLKKVPAGTPHDAVFGCQTDRGPAAIVCFGPQQIRTAYGFDKLIAKGFDGRGRTIVIVDAFQNPLIKDDLAAFDAAFGLPDPVFHQDAPQGLTPFDATDGNMVGWSAEISLDVEWAHAIAPGAKIELVLAKSNDDADILAATKWAVDNNVGDVISQSFGEAEGCVDPKIASQQHQVFKAATRKGITLFASSGDEGSAQPSCDGNSWIKAASSPANDPLVTAVGGTQLFAAPDQRCIVNKVIVPCPNPPAVKPGTYDHEVAWDELDQDPVIGPLGGDVATGGGFSTQFDRPDFQAGVDGANRHGRGVPDVAYNGAINHGVIAAWGVGGGFFIFGGTSSGSPQWSALGAIADQMAHHRLGSINPSLYELGDSHYFSNATLHDITVGQNGVMEFDSNNNPVNIPGFKAKHGWDATTGLGSPKADRLVPALVLLSH
jgi:subtilase family serine protease